MSQPPELMVSSPTQEIEAPIPVQPTTPFRNILVKGPNTGLCELAEPRLAEAFRDEAFIVVNGLMLVKGAGETVGIPLREEELPGGITKSDAWYEIDYGRNQWNNRREIREAFFKGKTHIELSGITAWFKLRDVDTEKVCQPGESLTDKARAAADKLQPGTPMLGGVSRRQYLFRRLYNLTPPY